MDTPFMASNAINTEQLSEIIETQYKFLEANPDKAKLIPPMFIHGAPGVGKSEIIKGVADKLGIGFIDIRLTQREPVDIRGLPVPNVEKGNVSWLISSDWPSDPTSRGIILFDELSAADRSLQVAAYEMILDRKLGSLYSLPNGWYIIAAGNRTEDEAVAMSMSSALANRFMHFEIQPDSETWVRWGMANGVSPSVLAYIRWKPDSLHKMDGENLERGWPSPRSWERVSMMESVYQDKTESQIFNRVVCGLVGEGIGIEYMAFKKMSKKFDNIREIMLNPNAAITIPTAADERYALCCAVAYHLWKAKDEDEQKALLDGFFRIEIELPGDFATMLMIDAISDGPRSSTFKASASKAMMIFKHKSYKEWEKKYGKQMHSKLNF